MRHGRLRLRGWSFVQDEHLSMRAHGIKLPERGRALSSLLAGPVFFSVGAAAACGNGVAAPPEGTGSYVLEQVDGASLPTTLADGTVIISGTLGLDVSKVPVSTGSAHVCVSNTEYAAPDQLATTATGLCKWTQNRQSISVEWSSAILNFGLLKGDTLSLSMHASATECPLVPVAECASSQWVYRR